MSFSALTSLCFSSLVISRKNKVLFCYLRYQRHSQVEIYEALSNVIENYLIQLNTRRDMSWINLFTKQTHRRLKYPKKKKLKLFFSFQWRRSTAKLMYDNMRHKIIVNQIRTRERRKMSREFDSSFFGGFQNIIIIISSSFRVLNFYSWTPRTRKKRAINITKKQNFFWKTWKCDEWSHHPGFSTSS